MSEDDDCPAGRVHRLPARHQRADRRAGQPAPSSCLCGRPGAHPAGGRTAGDPRGTGLAYVVVDGVDGVVRASPAAYALRRRARPRRGAPGAPGTWSAAPGATAWWRGLELSPRPAAAGRDRARHPGGDHCRASSCCTSGRPDRDRARAVHPQRLRGQHLPHKLKTRRGAP
ncbi:hypothetical protein QJS66_09575 [Kocuria rhizophila]|nr:hypothetical protein QJS66_09575 [Kocuria rhizophila]